MSERRVRTPCPNAVSERRVRRPENACRRQALQRVFVKNVKEKFSLTAKIIRQINSLVTFHAHDFSCKNVDFTKFLPRKCERKFPHGSFNCEKCRSRMYNCYIDVVSMKIQKMLPTIFTLVFKGMYVVLPLKLFMKKYFKN